jgi:MFS family permease
VLTQFLSWRWIFFINLPIAGLTMIGARAVVSETPEHQMRKGLDLWGAVAVTGGLTAFVYAISSTADHAVLSTRTMLPLLGSICLLGAFVMREVRVSRTGREPLVPFGLFRSRAVAGANLTMFMLSAAIFSMWLFLTLYYQQVLGLSPLLAGVAFVPQTLAIVLGAQISSRLIPRLGARPPLLAGALIATGGLGLLATMSPGDSYWTVAFGGGTATGLGMGIAMTPLAFAATARVLPTEAGLASGLLNTSRVLGGSIGLAVLDTIAVGRDHSVRAHLPPTDEAFRAAMVAGYSRAFVIAAALALLGAATAFFIPTIRRSPPDPGGADGASAPDTVIAGALVSDAVVLHRAAPPQNSC